MRTLALRRDRDPADPSVHAKAGKAFHRQITSARRTKIVNRVGYALLAALSLVGIVAGLSKPLAVKQLQQEVGGLNRQIAALTAPQFPIDSVETSAMQAADQCAAFTDQGSTAQVAAVETNCGWNGQGAALPVGLPQFNANPSLRPAVADGYTALPYVVQLMGSSGWLTYYVPVHQTSPTQAVVAGVPTPLNTPPGFVVNGCTQDASVSDPSSNSRVQAVEALVAGEPRYALPGHTISFTGNGLTGATASNEELCTASGNTQIVLATVTFNGPTQSAQVAVGLAFATTVISTREVRIASFGINAAYQPTQAAN